MSQVLEKEVRSSVEKLLDKYRISDYCVDIKPGTVTGDNYLGVISSVTVEGVDKEGSKVTLNFIVKSSQQDEEFRKVLKVHEIFEREIYVYTKIFPTFQQFQKEKGIKNVFDSFAKLHKYTLEDTSESLIMENMKELGYQLKNRLEPLDYHHASLIMKEYGRLHALSFALREQKPELFQKLTYDCRKNFFQNVDAESMNESLTPYFERAFKVLDPDSDACVIEKFKRYLDNPMDLLLEAVNVENAGKHAVIVHGDCWVNNILFKYDKPEKPEVPTKACLLDWQLTCAGSPALDLTYFIFTNTDKSLRDQYYNLLLEQYHNSFSSFLRELGGDPEELFSWATLQAHMKKFSVYGLAMTVMVTKLMLSEQDETHDFSKMTQEERLAVAKKEIRNVGAYDERIRGILKDMYRLGYL